MLRFKPLLNSVNKFSSKKSLLKQGDSVLIALSGGPDSICLALVLLMIKDKLRLKLAACHVNHNIRKSSSKDEGFVKRFCASHSLPIYARKISWRSKKAMSKPSIVSEEVLRNKRYKLLVSTAKQKKFNKIATAHTLDDQAETVMLRLMRGAGIRGLGAIRAQNILHDQIVVRPLLSIKKKLILETLRENRISFVEDSSNSKAFYLRNKLRLQLMPLLTKEYNSSMERHLVEIANDATLAYDFLEKECLYWMKNYFKFRKKNLSIPVRHMTKLHPVMQSEILFLAIEKKLGTRRRISRSHIDSMLELLNKGHKETIISLPHGLYFSRKGSFLVLKQSKSKN